MHRSLDYVQMIRGAETVNSKITTANNSHQHTHGKSFRKYEKFIKHYNLQPSANSQNPGVIKLGENSHNNQHNPHLAFDVLLLVIQYLQRKEFENCTTVRRLEKSLSSSRKELSKFENIIKALELREKVLIKIQCDKEMEFEEIKQHYETKINMLEGVIKKLHNNSQVIQYTIFDILIFF